MPAPSLDLDWELGVFKALRGLWRAVVPDRAPDYDAATVARLEDHRARFETFAKVVCGRPVRVREAREAGGIRGRDLLVPAWIDLAGDPELNRGLYLVRLAVDATTATRREPVPLDPEDNAQASRDAALRSVAALREELPRFGEAWDEARVLVGEADPAGLLWGRLIPVEIEEGSDVQPGEDDDEPPVDRDATEHEAPAFEELKVLDLDDEDALHLPIHAFEKVEMAEPFNGTMRQLDGEDDLDEHLEALQEVDLAHLMRGGPQAKSVYKAEIGLEADIPDVHRIEPGETALTYDEWDGKHRRYRPDWCSVYPTPMPRGSQAWASEAVVEHRRLIEDLYQKLLVHRSERAARPRQTDGDQVDIDAVVDAVATLHAGREPSQRLYIRRQRERRDVATTVLLDLSLSTDAWVENRRVLDVAREAVLVLGEVADRLGDRIQVLGLASHTRNQVRVWTVRDWDEPWSAARGRLGMVRPQGYTRIGPALRHATAELREVSARERLLLLISDGKPTDYDRYEGRYGVADVRQALREARRDGIHVHALAVDAVARDYLPEMLGPGRWDILPHPGTLPEALTRVYGRLT